MTHWLPKTYLELYEIPEVFNAADFCDFIKKGFCKEISIEFAQNVSPAYLTNFVNNVLDMKRTWASEVECPTLSIQNVKY